MRRARVLAAALAAARATGVFRRMMPVAEVFAR